MAQSYKPDTSVVIPEGTGSTVIHLKYESGRRKAFIWLLRGLLLGIFFAALGWAVMSWEGGESGDAVAVVRVEGVITSTDENESTTNAGSGKIIKALRQAIENEDVKAIVMRIDSPGGSVTGSAQIYEFITEIEKPIVVSMAGTAASGGYYISAPTDYIMARPDTFTGSIGVIMTLLNAEQFLTEWGIEVTMLTTGANKGIGSVWRDPTPEQEAILQQIINESYDEFVRIVAEGRQMDEQTVRQIADGRIYTGRQALANGLVDELGTFENAIDKAAELGGISDEEPRIIDFREDDSGVFGLLDSLSSTLNQSDSNGLLEADAVWEEVHELMSPRIEYRYLGPGGG